MKNKKDIKKLTLSAMFLALAYVMPFLTGQIPQIGSKLCPMHIPVLLCGFFKLVILFEPCDFSVEHPGAPLWD